MNSKTVDVIQGYRHKDYDYNVALAHFYRQIVTGEGYGELIVNYKRRETDEQKKQRVKITHVRTKSISNKIEGFFKRTFRADKIKFDISHDNDDTKARVGQYIDNYGNDGESLLVWSESTALFYNGLDPNAFYWVKHKSIDGVDSFEPFVFSSNQVLDYRIKNGLIEYCVCRLHHTVTITKGKDLYKEEIELYYTFTKEGLEIAIEVNDDIQNNSDFLQMFTDESGELMGEKQNVKDKTYLVIFEPSDIDNIPVSRMGYNHDKKTDMRTYVSYWDGATERFKILVADGSVFDVSKALHGFPQKYQYDTPCNFQDELMHTCSGGTLRPSGKECPSCGGSGMKVHNSEQDVILIPLPTEDNPIVVMPKDLAAYAEEPFKFMEMQKALIKEATPLITESIFGVDISHQQNTNATATQVSNYYDTAQDTLFDFTKAPRRLFLFTVDIIAKSLGIEGLGAALEYTNRYDLESEDFLITLLGKAKVAGAGTSVIDNILARLAVKQNRTASSKVNVFEAIRQFIPFSNVPEKILESLILSLPDSSVQKALYLNSKEIATEISNTMPTFLTMAYDAQKNIVEGKAMDFAQKAVSTNSVRGISEISRTEIDNTEG